MGNFRKQHFGHKPISPVLPCLPTCLVVAILISMISFCVWPQSVRDREVSKSPPV